MFGIPTEKLPEFLKDEERINVLFAPLRNRSVNPRDYDSKISAWKSIIKVYCDCTDTFSFTQTSLSNTFIRYGRPPSCLPEVFAEMVKVGEIQTFNDFLKSTSPKTWSGWATDLLIKKPFSWSLNKIKKSIFTTIESEVTYVHLEVIKSKSQRLLSSIPAVYINKLVSLGELLKVLEKEIESADNIKLLLNYLLGNGQIDITYLENSKGRPESEVYMVKFGDGGKVKQISDIDIGVYTLEQNEKLLSQHLETLEDQIQICVKEAKEHLSKNHRQLAKTSLRKKHELEKRVEKKANALNNIHVLLEKIHDTHSDAHVWLAYKNALSAFDTTFKETEMSEDAIEDTMIKLGDVLDQHDDIQEALARSPLDTNDSDLEEELLELLKEDADEPPPDDSGITSDLEKKMEKIVLDLPGDPEESPDASLLQMI